MSSFGANGEQKRTVSHVLERLNEARHRQFVGREAERALFESIITATELPIILLYVYGPGGVGKTSLLREFSYIARRTNVATIYVDMRDVRATPDAFTDALKRAMAQAPQSPTSSRQIILIDTYEKIRPLDTWLRDSFLPHLPDNTLVVMAGQDELPAPWRSDAGWRTLVGEIPLRNFSTEESQTFLAKRGIPAEQHQGIFDFTHGHPLALSLIADEFTQRADFEAVFKPEQSPYLIKTLLDRFIRDIPSPVHRTALEACAQVHLMSEPLLATMLDVEDAHPVFEWLRGLSFIEAGPQGLFLHELAGKALAADLRWRNAELYDTLLERARSYYTDRLSQADAAQQQHIIADYMFLHRHNPIVQPFFDVSDEASALADAASEADWPLLTDMVRQHEGDEAADLAACWFERQPGNVLVIRSTAAETAPEPLGFLLTVDLTAADPNDIAADPATRAAWHYLHENAPLRSGEMATIFRFWMGREAYQTISSVVALIGVNMVRHYLTTPGLAHTFFPCADPDLWLMLCTYANLSRLPEAEFEVGGRHYGVYGHDWRVTPPLQWLDLLAARENSLFSQQTPPPPAAEPLIVLSRSEFDKAIREVFRNLPTPEVLRHNPLLRSHLVVNAAPEATTDAEKIDHLCRLVKEAAESLQTSPRQTKFYRALYHTYIQPAPTQEQAAELLDLPFSTFRRHLKTGLEEVADLLWQQEIG